LPASVGLEPADLAGGRTRDDRDQLALTEVIGTGVSVLLVEQNAALAMRLADTVIVVGHGEVQTSGSADDLGQELLASYVQ
jgi:ABC-type branched-subunit amino acid transport system ATPase component